MCLGAGVLWGRRAGCGWGGRLGFGNAWAAVIRGVFGAGSGFRVGWRAVGLAEFLFWRGDWGLGHHSMGFKLFPDIS